MIEDEDTDYKTAKELAGYRITPKLDPRPENKDEGQANNPAASHSGGAIAYCNPELEDEAYLPGTPRITARPVKRQRKSASTGASFPTGSTAPIAIPTGIATARTIGRIGRGVAMGSETLHGGGEKHVLGEGTVFGDGGRAAQDLKGVGHGATQVPRAD